MDNTFDFYVVKFYSDKKTPLNQIKKSLKRIHATLDRMPNGYKTYGTKRFPQWLYFMRFESCDANEQLKLADIEHRAKEIAASFGVKVCTKYIAD